MQENAPSCVKNQPTPQEWRDKINEIKIVMPSGCWECNFAPNSHGYIHVQVKNFVKRAHRASYKAFVGEIQNGLFACHKCDNRKCFNPEHIFIGTQKDNIRDAVSKNRMASGSKHWNSKLSPEDFEKIRELRLSGLPYKTCGLAVGVSKKTAMNALKGRGYLVEQASLGDFKCPEFNKKTRLTAEIVKSMYEMVSSGISKSDTAKHLGVSVSTIYSAFRTKKWIREIPELANRVKRKSPTRALKPAP